MLPVLPPEHPAAVAIIPARFESSRFPGKPLALIAGRPMIEHVYLRAARARAIDRVLVATDDERIVRAVESFGGEAWMTRPDHRTGTDRIAEVAAQLSCDIVVNVQGDEPLIEPEMIDEVIAPLVHDAELLMASLRHRTASADELADPNVVKVVVDRRDRALYFSRAPIPYEGAANVPDSGPWRHIGLYAYRRSFLPRFTGLPSTPLERRERLEQLRALEHGIPIVVVETRHEAIGVDTPADLQRVAGLLAAMEPVGGGNRST